MKKSQKTQTRRNDLSWSRHPAVWDLLDFWYFHVWAQIHFSLFATDYAIFSKFLHDFYPKSTYFDEIFYFEFYLKCSSVGTRIKVDRNDQLWWHRLDRSGGHTHEQNININLFSELTTSNNDFRRIPNQWKRAIFQRPYACRAGSERPAARTS